MIAYKSKLVLKIWGKKAIGEKTKSNFVMFITQ